MSATDVQPLMAGPADTSVADILLVPSFQSAGARLRLTEGDPTYVRSAYVDSLQVGSAMSGDISASVTLRLNARSFRTGRTFTWLTVGGTGPLHTSWGRDRKSTRLNSSH